MACRGGGRADVITLSGSGEPTLHSRFGEVLDSKIQVNTEALLSMLRRRPCTSEQIAKAFGMHANEVSKYLGSLLRTGRIRTIRKNGSVYYAIERLEDEHAAINVFDLTSKRRSHPVLLGPSALKDVLFPHTPLCQLLDSDIIEKK